VGAQLGRVCKSSDRANEARWLIAASRGGKFVPRPCVCVCLFKMRASFFLVKTSFLWGEKPVLLKREELCFWGSECDNRPCSLASMR